MVRKIICVASVAMLVACGGGSESSGDIEGVNQEVECEVVADEISLDSGASCELSSDTVSTYNLNVSDETVSCQGGRVTIAGSLDASSPATLNGLTINCGS